MFEIVLNAIGAGKCLKLVYNISLLIESHSTSYKPVNAEETADKRK